MRWLSLSSRVTLFSTLGLAAVWLVAVLLMASVLWSEQEELFDQQLAETAHALLPMLSQAGDAPDLTAPRPERDPTEALVYRLFDAGGNIRRQTPLPQGLDLPDPVPGRDGFSRSADYRIYTTGYNDLGLALQLGAPLAERREAFREGLGGFLLPMLALLPLAWLMVRWLSRRALAPMRELRAEIARRDGHRLDPIDTTDWPEDLVRIAGTFNGFMARLTAALDAERAFATNAAHELRTPVAIALAQVQQLREGASDEQRPRIEATERALQRMRRLVARLLQLARADAGIGRSDQPHDLVALTRLVLDDIGQGASAGRIDARLPARPVWALIDPDAFAMVLGNLVENGLQHGLAGGAVSVAVRPGAVVEVTNDGAPAADPAALRHRFVRRGQRGFGLGLHICTQIVEQAGGVLDLISPVPGRQGGFMARMTLRTAPPPPAPAGIPGETGQEVA